MSIGSPDDFDSLIGCRVAFPAENFVAPTRTGILLGESGERVICHGSAEAGVLCAGQIVMTQKWLIKRIEATSAPVQLAARRLWDTHCFKKSSKADWGRGFREHVRREGVVELEAFYQAEVPPLLSAIRSLSERLSQSDLRPTQEYLELFSLVERFFGLPNDLRRKVPENQYPREWRDFFYFDGTSVARSRQVLSAEYIKEIGQYLIERVRFYKQMGIDKPKIVDACAGIDMTFASHMRRVLWQEYGVDGVDWVSTDEAVPEDYRSILRARYVDSVAVQEYGALEGHLKRFSSAFEDEFGIPAVEVQKMRAQDISTLQPDIVVCAWMPYKVSLSADFKACPTVKEYLMIGPEEICGTERDWTPDANFSRLDVEISSESLGLNLYSPKRVSSVASFRRKQ